MQKSHNTVEFLINKTSQHPTEVWVLMQDYKLNTNNVKNAAICGSLICNICWNIRLSKDLHHRYT